MYTATDDRDPLTGTGCSTPAYNGKVFQTTTAMGLSEHFLALKPAFESIN
jgi:hypothetical protein